MVLWRRRVRKTWTRSALRRTGPCLRGGAFRITVREEVREFTLGFEARASTGGAAMSAEVLNASRAKKGAEVADADLGGEELAVASDALSEGGAIQRRGAETVGGVRQKVVKGRRHFSVGGCLRADRAKRLLLR